MSIHEFSFGAADLRNACGDAIDEEEEQSSLSSYGTDSSYNRGDDSIQLDMRSVDGIGFTDPNTRRSKSRQGHWREEEQGSVLERSLASLKQIQSKPALMRTKLTLVFFSTALCWGSALLFINKCLPRLDPLSIGCGRCTIACGIMVLFHIWKCFIPIGNTAESRANERAEIRATLGSRRALAQMCVMGVIFSAISSTLIAVSEVHISGGLASILLMVEPLVTPFLAKLFLPRAMQTERIDKWTVLGLFFGCVGTAVSALPTLSGSDSHVYLFVFVAMMGSVGFAVGTIVGQYFASSSHIPPRPIFHRVTGQLFFGALFLIPITSILRSQSVFDRWNGTDTLIYMFGVGWETWMWLLALGSVCTVGSWFLFYILLREMGSLTTSVNFLIPPISLLQGAAFHSEWDGLSLRDKLLEVGGMVIVLVGVAAVMFSARPIETAATVSPSTHAIQSTQHSVAAPTGANQSRKKQNEDMREPLIEHEIDES